MEMTKSRLAIRLSQLDTFDNAKEGLEQYPTDSEIAASVLWEAYMHGDIKGKLIADLGAGTGILGIGALLLGAKKVYFVEKDAKAVKLLKQNIEKPSYKVSAGSYEIINDDISDFHKKTDVVLENPPFGTRQKHSDAAFLKKAFETAGIIYTLHKSSTGKYITELAKKNDFAATNIYKFDFPLKRTMRHHTRRIHRIRVSCFRLEKPKLI